MTVSDWAPSASIHTLRARANMMADIRLFFTERGYLEVETPIMAAFGVTDVYLESIALQCLGREYFLQTSPEYHMKRLLASGSGPIFQLSRAFRDDEAGRWHNPEFTMLEWYRPGMNHYDMLEEIDIFLKKVLKTNALLIKTYQNIFESACNINPFDICVLDLKKKLEQFGLANILSPDEQDIDQYLFLLMSHVVEPWLATHHEPIAVTDFPISQAALARVRDGVAERFEVYYQGIELANGFHELTDHKVQAARFKADNQKRLALGLKARAVDARFLAAMTHGLPPSTGVALGVDRLLALALKQTNIQDCLAFDVSRA
ncbi:MAG: elongation factor P--(R)-beta-lysine ligase [Gammaproteobacteria bacterium]|nr:elongation factor P--(R)-beta-lysine ligase [Gammaproteobacteria bacterium]MCH9764350.1 elongation factor P--(R)-beta-lysine ligase [Gammaproteobacteria bacterium]